MPASINGQPGVGSSDFPRKRQKCRAIDWRAQSFHIVSMTTSKRSGPRTRLRRICFPSSHSRTPSAVGDSHLSSSQKLIKSIIDTETHLTTGHRKVLGLTENKSMLRDANGLADSGTARTTTTPIQTLVRNQSCHQTSSWISDLRFRFLPATTEFCG